MRSNRTFMELKYVSVIPPTLNLTVLIVPLWNWNLQNRIINSTSICSNRTFMELKYTTSLCEAPSFERSNRTFMELKCKIAKARSYGLSVLIVPLWNWNRREFQRWKTLEGSNRTFMELKWRSAETISMLQVVLIVPLWNWNRCFNRNLSKTQKSSNRTFMELK